MFAGFGLLVFLLTQKSIANLEILRNEMWILSIVCIMFFTWATTKFSLYMSGEIDKLNTHVKHVANGALEESQLLESSSEEIVELSDHLNTMVQNLQAALFHAESEQKKFAAVFSNMSDAIVITDENWTVVNSNKNAQQQLGIEPEKNLFAQLVKTFQLSTSVAELHSAETDKAPLCFDMILPETENSKERIFAAKLSSVPTSYHSISYVLTAQDVTAARHEELNKNDMLSLVSHKLLTPLSSIIMTTSLFRDGVLGEMSQKQQEHLEKMLHQTRKMQSLIQHLIQFAYITSEHQLEKIEKMNIDQFLEEFSTQQQRKNQTQKIHFELHKDSSIGEWKLNKHYLNMMLNELVENAVKFGKRENIHIDLHVKKDHNKLKIEVHDNGKGIPRKFQDDIFLRFFQIDRDFTGSIDGLGLGLPMVKNIVQQLGGSLAVESEEGKGSTFVVEFPEQ